MNKTIEPVCSFCGKPKSAVRELIAGPENVFICNECVEICNHILSKAESAPDESVQASLPTPEQI